MLPRPILLCVTMMVTVWSGAYSHPDGAPLSTCQSMTPGHGSVQTGSNPYRITVPATTSTYASGVPIPVTIVGTFQGVILQARRVSGSDDPVGTFTSPAAVSNLKRLSCGGTDGSAITHASSDSKTDSVVMWNPPNSNVGDIEFVATVAQGKQTWWKNTKSAALTPDRTYPTEAPNTGSHLKGAGGMLSLCIMGVTLTAVYVIGL